jgi:hypothetical protein
MINCQEMLSDLTLQRGVTSAARHSVNITCRGVMSTARHAALSLIRLYLDNIGSKCNQTALCVFRKELAFILCGSRFLQIIASFFLSTQSLGFLFAVSNFIGSFMGLWNEEMKYETNGIAFIA